MWDHVASHWICSLLSLFVLLRTKQQIIQISMPYTRSISTTVRNGEIPQCHAGLDVHWQCVGLMHLTRLMAERKPRYRVLETSRPATRRDHSQRRHGIAALCNDQSINQSIATCLHALHTQVNSSVRMGYSNENLQIHMGVSSTPSPSPPPAPIPFS